MPLEIMNLIMRASVTDPTSGVNPTPEEGASKKNAAASCCNGGTNMSATTTANGASTPKGVSRYFRRAMEQRRER